MAPVETWGAGPTILCIHGIASSRKSWERFGRHFASRFRTVAFDQKGHGDAASSPGSMDHETIVAEACTVAASLGDPVIAVVGHSWGGAIAIRAALQIPSAKAVVAVDPMIYVPPGTWAQEYLDDVEADLALDPAARERAIRERSKAWHELDITGKLHAMRAMRADSIAALGADNRVDAGGWDLRPILTAYPKPLLVAAAAPGDSVMTAGDLALLRSQENRERISVVDFPDQGHNLHRTAFERFVETVDRFLTSQKLD